MADGKAFSSDEPTTVQAFLAAAEARREFAAKVVAAAKVLGKNRGALHADAAAGARETVGLGALDPNDPPEGWTYSAKRGFLVPARGGLGEAARAWLAEHQAPDGTDVHKVLSDHGLPPADLLGGTGLGSFRVGSPALFHLDGVVWALYRGTPGRWICEAAEPTWTPRRLSEYWAAREAVEAKEKLDA